VPVGDLRKKTLTTDPDELREHFEKAPWASYALVCGTGIAVLDLDGSLGTQSLVRLVDQHGLLEIGPVVATPGTNGLHYYFRSPGLPTNDSFVPGLDWLDVGKAVMGAGSVHKNGQRYEWVIRPGEMPLVTPPAWLVELVRKPTAVRYAAPVVTGGTAYARSALRRECETVTARYQECETTPSTLPPSRWPR
jgi:hypothetical protein